MTASPQAALPATRKRALVLNLPHLTTPLALLGTGDLATRWGYYLARLKGPTC